MSNLDTCTVRLLDHAKARWRKNKDTSVFTKNSKITIIVAILRTNEPKLLPSFEPEFSKCFGDRYDRILSKDLYKTFINFICRRLR
jgi:hypothetical protein